MIKLLTCQTWVTRWEWFDYAQHHREHVPFLLADRSPCMDPFLDPYAPSQERRPIISGLCRTFKRFSEGAIYIYLTTVDQRVCHALGIPRGSYLGIAALKITKVHCSHTEAANTFTPRRYIVAPDHTPYPPNLAHDPHMPAAIQPESCIIWLNPTTPLTPDHFDEVLWRNHVTDYYKRQAHRHLRAAECRLLHRENREVLQLDHEHAPVLTPADWGETHKMTRGQLPPQPDDWTWAEHLYIKIAHGR